MTDNNLNEYHLLVVDDDPLIHQAIKMSISKPWIVTSTLDPQKIPKDYFFHAAFVDMHLIKNSLEPIGIHVIMDLHQRNPQIEIVAMSGIIDRSTMEHCLKAGAQKFLAKPLSSEEVLSVLEKILAYWQLRNVYSQLQSKNSLSWIGSSPSSQNIRKKIAELKGERKSILIEGETGSGKEVVAKLLHAQEGDRPFIAVNVSSIPENLIESEMFGYVKGAFTGADQNKIGLTEAAHGGDLFLDEIEVMPLSFQVKMLRFLESGEIRKIGAKESIKIQTRVIAASNRPLSELITEGLFREDLYYRISSQRISIPSLKERKEDIPELAKYFLSLEKPIKNKSFAIDGIQELLKYSWPGNVRELKRICEQLCLISPLPIIRAEDVLPLTTTTNSAVNMPKETMAFIKTVDTVDSSLVKLAESEGLDTALKNIEKKIIDTVLETTNQNREKAAEILKISKSNLYKKIKDYSIDENGGR